MEKSIIIIGMGPGLSYSVSKVFGAMGFQIGMISRSESNLKEYKLQLSQSNIEAKYAVADAADSKTLIAAINKLTQELPNTSVLFYNAVAGYYLPVLEENIESLTLGFKVGVGNVVTAVQQLLPELTKNNGSILLTGGGYAQYPDPNLSNISLSKAGINNLAKQLNKALNNQVYVGTISIMGEINKQNEKYSPDRIAREFWQLHDERIGVEKIY